MVDFSIAFRLSLQRALWGMIPTNLRAVAMGWEEGNIGTARFIFDGVPGEVELELVGDVETEVIADFDDEASFSFTSEIGAMDVLALTSSESWWAFRRA